MPLGIKSRAAGTRHTTTATTTTSTLTISTKCAAPWRTSRGYRAHDCRRIQTTSACCWTRNGFTTSTLFLRVWALSSVPLSWAKAFWSTAATVGTERRSSCRSPRSYSIRTTALSRASVCSSRRTGSNQVTSSRTARTVSRRNSALSSSSFSTASTSSGVATAASLSSPSRPWSLSRSTTIHTALGTSTATVSVSVRKTTLRRRRVLCGTISAQSPARWSTHLTHPRALRPRPSARHRMPPVNRAWQTCWSCPVPTKSDCGSAGTTASDAHLAGRSRTCRSLGFRALPQPAASPSVQSLRRKSTKSSCCDDKSNS
eukprot:PhM_4_TR9167/c0_g1_i1/m.94507